MTSASPQFDALLTKDGFDSCFQDVRRALINMSECLHSTHMALENFKSMVNADTNFETAFVLSTFIIGFMRNMSSVATFATTESMKPAEIENCTLLVAKAILELKVYRADATTYRRVLAHTLMSCKRCKGVFRGALKVIRDEYQRIKYHFSQKVEEGIMTSEGVHVVLDIVETFMLRSTPFLLCLSFSSLQFVIYLSHLVAQSPSVADIPGQGCAQCQHLIARCSDFKTVLNSVHPLHQRNIQRAAIIFT